MVQIDSELVGASGLPVPVDVQGARPSLLRPQTTAAFISQLLAERDRLPPQRQKRRESVAGALGAYSDGARIAVRRVPQGFRKTVIV